MTEIQNPFKNGKLVEVNYDQREYIKQSVQRGHPDYVMSRSDLVEFDRCPSRWRRGYRENEEGTDATEWGSLIDCMLFDRDRFRERFSVKPETYPAPASHAKVKSGKIKEGDPLPWNGNATWCEDWILEHKDQALIKYSDYQKSETAQKMLVEDDSIGLVLRFSDFQVYCTAEYHDRDTGVVVPVKTLSDIVPRGLRGDGVTDDTDAMNLYIETNGKSETCANSIIDFKTGKSANPIGWAREVNSRGYDVQAALNLDVYNAATGEERFEFRHIVQESFPPFESAKILLSTEFVDMGRHKYLKSLRMYAECLKTNVWPGYDQLSQTALGGWSLVDPEGFMLK